LAVNVLDVILREDIGESCMNTESDANTLPPLVYLGDANLMSVQPSVDAVAFGSEALAEKLAVLRACMGYYRGIGIAAPQIGWNVRAFCLGIDDHSERYPGAEPIAFEFWINPRVEPIGDDSNWAWEGCLSVPGMRGWVQRPARIKAIGQSRDGAPKERVYEGFAARVFQHEYDHLDGILFPMRVTHPRRLIPDPVMARQSEWANDWPSPGAYRTRPGELCESE
jgi:peptide deformylase